MLKYKFSLIKKERLRRDAHVQFHYCHTCTVCQQPMAEATGL